MPKFLKTPAERKAAFLTAAASLYDQLETWYQAHPSASFGELEQAARQPRRSLMGQMLATLINGRTTGYQAERPLCPQCQQAMDFAGYRPWSLSGLEGETTLQRAYYVCPHCEQQTLFPP